MVGWVDYFNEKNKLKIIVSNNSVGNDSGAAAGRGPASLVSANLFKCAALNPLPRHPSDTLSERSAGN